MAAGDLLSADWQLELQGVLTGAGTEYEFAPEGISGLGVPRAKTADVDLDGQDGAFASPDFMDVRVLLVSYEISAGSADAAFALLASLNDVWLPLDADVELHLQLPGFGHVYWVGRPRGLDVDTTLARGGIIEAIGEFHALEPRMITVGS